jgi:hypothetical protein
MAERTLGGWRGLGTVIIDFFVLKNGDVVVLQARLISVQLRAWKKLRDEGVKLAVAALSVRLTTNSKSSLRPFVVDREEERNSIGATIRYLKIAVASSTSLLQSSKRRYALLIHAQAAGTGWTWREKSQRVRPALISRLVWVLLRSLLRISKKQRDMRWRSDAASESRFADQTAVSEAESEGKIEESETEEGRREGT